MIIIFNIFIKDNRIKSIGLLKVLKLLDSIGEGFKKDDKVHYVYYYIVLNYTREDTQQCNYILDKGFNKEILQPYISKVMYGIF